MKGFESQVANIEDSVLTAVRSQAQTPAPTTIDIREQINVLLSQGQINKAFYHALHANDLLLVEYTLGKADINAVFDPCVLEQTVLLSLIQQISADMTNHTELKHKYGPRCCTLTHFFSIIDFSLYFLDMLLMHC